ncbi:hypothetical protein C8R45DRAFT_923086 [Mycena sanguinolenta]|nr:hypothetical protein C8R45DRAFT_923086 [Mycena sanguinolenta]
MAEGEERLVGVTLRVRGRDKDEQKLLAQGITCDKEAAYIVDEGKGKGIAFLGNLPNGSHGTFGDEQAESETVLQDRRLQFLVEWYHGKDGREMGGLAMQAKVEDGYVYGMSSSQACGTGKQETSRSGDAPLPALEAITTSRAHEIKSVATVAGVEVGDNDKDRAGQHTRRGRGEEERAEDMVAWWHGGESRLEADIVLVSVFFAFALMYQIKTHRLWPRLGFSIYEYRTFSVEIVKNFEFSMKPRVRREAALVMVPGKS